MKKTILTTVLILTMAAGSAMAQDHMMIDMADGQDMQQGKGMMMGDKGMMMHGSMDCMNMKGQGVDKGMMNGGMMNHMSAENQHKFMNDTTKMRQKMHMMRFEHMEAKRNPKTSLEDIADMEQKMVDMRKDIMQMAEKYQEMKK